MYTEYSKVKMTKKICISGYYGFDNFGDETILKILTEHIKNYKCDTEITVFSAFPEKTAENLKVKCVNSFYINIGRRKPASRLYKRKKFDLLFINFIFGSFIRKKNNYICSRHRAYKK